ncbi:hypothetical protein ACIG87_17305 [Micromonospora sp. NPDC051925]|uniref:hypothetical protein n=1 Tax=Micromonospora sp. NPDC051925 TaxID=3364288 RepID=UPI0037C5A8FB
MAAMVTPRGGRVGVRRRAQLAAPDHRAEFVGLVEAATTYLVQSGRTRAVARRSPR